MNATNNNNNYINNNNNNNNKAHNATLQPYEIQPLFDKYSNIVILNIAIIGLILNIVTIFVYYRNKNLRRLSIAVYTIALAISDSCVLLFSAIPFAYVTTRSNFIYCAIVPYLDSVFCFSSSWYIVAILSERCLIVCFPAQCKKYNNFEHALKVVIVIGIIPFFVFLWGLISVLVNFKRDCDAQQLFGKNFLSYFIFITSINYTIPFCLLLILSIVFIIQLKRKTKKRRILSRSRTFQTTLPKLESTDNMDSYIVADSSKDRVREPVEQISYKFSSRNTIHQPKCRDKTRTINLMFISICIAYLLFTFPHIVACTYYELNMENINDHSFLRTVIMTTTLMLSYLNYVTNFIFYSAFSKLFQTELKKLFICKKLFKVNIFAKR